VTPAVSILMPVRDAAPFLPAALESIFRQTFRDWELVAIDDHSTDRTPEILAEAAADRRVQVVRPERPGLVNALNTGLSRCRAPLVARMDGDDVSHPMRLQLQEEHLRRNPEIGLVGSDFRHFPRRELRKGMLGYESWQNSLRSHGEIMRDLFVESPFVHPSVMFRSEIIEKTGGYRALGWPEDYDLWLRMAEAGTSFARLPETLFFWRDRPQRATRTMEEYRAEAFRRCKIDFLRRMFLRGSDEVVLAGAGIEGRAWRKGLAEVDIRVGLWLDVDPRKRGRILHGSQIVSPADYRFDGRKMLITIGTPAGRESGRRWALGTGLREWTDFLCVT
jgi:glycosyltransferase involved in cell wall biosynthesis